MNSNDATNTDVNSNIDTNIDTENTTYIYLNFRGKKTYLRKDTLDIVPYLHSLVTSSCKTNPKDEEGLLIVDESASTVFFIIDAYRCWLEDGKPLYLLIDIPMRISRGLYASVAKRDRKSVV